MQGLKDRILFNGDKPAHDHCQIDEYGLQETSDSPNFPKTAKTDEREHVFNHNAQLMKELLMISKQNSTAKELIWKRLGESRIDEANQEAKKPKEPFPNQMRSLGGSRASSARKKNPENLVPGGEGSSSNAVGSSKKVSLGLQNKKTPHMVTFGTIPPFEEIRQNECASRDASQTDRSKPKLKPEGSKLTSSQTKCTRVSPTKARPLPLRSEDQQASLSMSKTKTETKNQDKETRKGSVLDAGLGRTTQSSRVINSIESPSQKLQSSLDNTEAKAGKTSPGFPTKEDFKRLQMRRIKMGRASSTWDDISAQSGKKVSSVVQSPQKQVNSVTERRSDPFDFKSTQFSQARIMKTAGSYTNPDKVSRAHSSRSPSHPARSKSSTRKSSMHQKSLPQDGRISPSIVSPMMTPSGKQAKRIEFLNISPTKATRQAEYDLNPLAHLVNAKSSTRMGQGRVLQPTEQTKLSTRSINKVLHNRASQSNCFMSSSTTAQTNSQRHKEEVRQQTAQSRDHRPSTNVLLDLVLQKKLQASGGSKQNSFLKSAQKDPMLSTAGACFFKHQRDSLTTEDSIRVLKVSPTPLDTAGLSFSKPAEKELASQSVGTKDTKELPRGPGERDSISLGQIDQSLESMFQSIMMKSEAFHSSLFM